MSHRSKAIEETTEAEARPQESNSASGAGSGKKSVERNAEKAKTSKRNAASRNESQIDALNDIERETANPELTTPPESDLQGISRAETADSESVEELVEEGNIFEAGAVAGVEEADAEDLRPVHTRQLLEDDVPEEYLDND